MQRLNKNKEKKKEVVFKAKNIIKINKLDNHI